MARSFLCDVIVRVFHAGQYRRGFPGAGKIALDPAGMEAADPMGMRAADSAGLTAGPPRKMPGLRYIWGMRYVCDAPGGKTWFSMETQSEADAESSAMQHAVAKHFQRAVEAARMTYQPREGLASFERDIGLKDHVTRTTPLFLTLRAGDGEALATAMIPRSLSGGRIIIVGPANNDPWPEHASAIAALGDHFGRLLPRSECYPYA